MVLSVIRQSVYFTLPYIFGIVYKSEEWGENMRWDKALNLLISIFLCVNIALAWINYEKLVKTYEVSDGRIKTIVSILDKENIKIEGKLPTVFSPKSSIWIEPIEITSSMRDSLVECVLGKERDLITITKDNQDVKYGRNALVYGKGEEELRFYKESIIYTNKSLAQQRGKLTEKEAFKYAKKFIERLNLEEYLKDAKIEAISESYGWDVTYYGVYKGLPVFDSFVKVKVSEAGVFEAEVKCIDITDKVGRLKPLYPIDDVLFGLQELKLEQDQIVVESVELGYRLDHTEGMHILAEEAVPMYKIQIRGLATPIFVNAYTNTYEEILFISQH